MERGQEIAHLALFSLDCTGINTLGSFSAVVSRLFLSYCIVILWIISTPSHKASIRFRVSPRPLSRITFNLAMSPISLEMVTIAAKKALYTRAVDTAQWSLLETIVPSNFSFKILGSDGNIVDLDGFQVNFSTREAFLEHFQKLLRTKQSTHLVGPPEIEQASPNEIKTIFGVQFLVADKGSCPKERLTAAGHYHDTWKKLGDEWLLTDVALEVCYMTFDP